MNIACTGREGNLRSSRIGSKGKTSRRLPSLDGWRAVAILLVLLSHWWATGGADNIPRWIRPITGQGDLGVRIFLVLSGLLITHLLLEENDSYGSIDLRSFYIRRVLRIFPVYFAFLLLLATLSAFGLYYDDVATWIGALTFTRNVIGKGNSATGHLWSLAVEEQFYFVWPSTMMAAKLGNRPRIAMTALITTVVAVTFLRVIPCTGTGVICTKLLGKSLCSYTQTHSRWDVSRHIHFGMPGVSLNTRPRLFS
jgi:peptidoglycan/LPS O-acetylase OafA/YrhL